METRTEDIFRDKLIKAGYSPEMGGKITIDRQTCSLAEINELFQHASKTEGSDRPGYPDFIITSKDYKDIVIIVECKASATEESLGIACKEAVHYANFLVGKYNIVVIGAVGETEAEFKMDTAVWTKDNLAILPKAKGFNGGVILSFKEYDSIIHDDEVIEDISTGLKEVKEKINWMLYAAGNLNSDKRMMILSACLLSLRDRSFRESFGLYGNEFILEETIRAVERALKSYGIADDKCKTMMRNFEALKQLDILSSVVEISGGSANPIKYILNTLHDSKIHNAIEESAISIDIMGEFYNEFITHKGDLGNAKNGFVLTPRHVCDLFAELGELDETTKILDMCFGTGGFLVAGMQKEIQAAKGDQQKIDIIRRNNICGVEIDGDRFTYGCVNMILRGDGQSNMVLGDCFASDVRDKITSKGCSVGFINPPYALKTLELHFIKNMLECLAPGGRGIAIVPQSCCTNKNSEYTQIRQEILREHTLEAVISMPDQLFYPKAGVVTCVMIFTAGKPHNPDRKSWFANLKDDGFVIDRRSNGRADINNRWEGIKKKLLTAFLNRDTIEGFSLTHSVTAADEWSYAAYAKTDFQGLTEESFKKVIKEYVIFKLSQVAI